MNITHNIVVGDVQLTIEASHSVTLGDAEDMTVEVFQDGARHSLQRVITKPTGHFVTDDGMVDTAEPCNCGPNAACSSCPAPELPTTATAESALTAVYAAIEKEVDGYDNAGVLSGLADLVNALMSASVTEG